MKQVGGHREYITGRFRGARIRFCFNGLTVLVLVTTFLGLFACAHPPERANPVGRSFAVYEDSTRRSWIETGNRPLATTIWYPTVQGSRETEWRIGVFRAGWTAQGAPIAATPTKLPLIILSHGTGGAAAQLSWLAETLASNGYIVAAVNHHGNTAFEETYLPQGFMLWWERAQDISVVIDKLLADPRFGPRIDVSGIGAAGFSLGGYTVLAMAGARLDKNQLKQYCTDKPNDPSCKLPPEAPFSMSNVQRLSEQDEGVKSSLSRAEKSYRDTRVRAVYAIAPVLGPALNKQSLADIAIPVRIVVGTMDDQAPPKTNAEPIASFVPRAELQLLPDAIHYTFLACCSIKGQLFVRPLCSDPARTDRENVHKRVSADALDYFNRTLPQNIRR